jgi:stage III sporulation protein AD
MQIFQLVGIAIITAVAALLLKGTKPELAFAVTIAGGIILLLFAFEIFKGSLTIFQKITDITGIESSIVKILLKMVGIGYLVEFSAGILNDFGQSNLGDKLVFCGKIIVLVLAVPILESVLNLIVKLLEFV